MCFVHSKDRVFTKIALSHLEWRAWFPCSIVIHPFGWLWGKSHGKCRSTFHSLLSFYNKRKANTFDQTLICLKCLWIFTRHHERKRNKTNKKNCSSSFFFLIELLTLLTLHLYSLWVNFLAVRSANNVLNVCYHANRNLSKALQLSVGIAFHHCFTYTWLILSCTLREEDVSCPAFILEMWA